MMWTISELIDIVNEGVTHSNTESMSVSTSDPSGPPVYSANVNVQYAGNAQYGGPSGLCISFSVEMPLEKIKDLTITNAQIESLVVNNSHPVLNQNGNYFVFNSYDSWTISSGKVTIPIKLFLDLNELKSTARKIRDDKFHSLLDAALGD